MLKRRIIPKLQFKARSKDGRVNRVLVTTIGFREIVEIGDPFSQAKIYEAQAADELIFLNLDATEDGLEHTLPVVRQAAEEIFMPLTVGGGVKTVQDFRTLLQSGADKVSVNTGAVENPQLISEASARFGAQCVVASIDYRATESGYEVFIKGASAGTGLDPVDWALDMEKLGAGEILLTSVDRDGSRQGLDLELTKRVVQSVSIPVITAGGCGLAAHFVEGFLKGGACAVSAGTYFCFKDENLMQVRSQIKNAGIPIRLHS